MMCLHFSPFFHLNSLNIPPSKVTCLARWALLAECRQNAQDRLCRPLQAPTGGIGDQWNKQKWGIPDLVGGWTNPLETYCRSQNGFIFPNFRGENKTYWKPPPRNTPCPLLLGSFFCANFKSLRQSCITEDGGNHPYKWTWNPLMEV